MIGSKTSVPADLGRAAKDLANILVNELGYPLAGDKAVAVSNDDQVLKAIVADIGHLAGTAEEAANKLGIEYTSGKRRPKRGGPRRARYGRQLMRRRRMTKLRKLGCSIAQVVKRGLTPAASYGGTVHGVSDYELEILASLTATATPPNTRGTSRTLKLQLHGDPATEANAGIIQFWAGAAWRACGPLRARRRTDPSPVLLDNAIRRADRTLNAEGFKWENVRGPAGAAIMTARRIGWRFLSGLRIADERGSVIDLGATDPHNVRAAVVRATRADAMIRASKREEMGETTDGIWISPVMRVLRNNKITPMARAALRRAFTGGSWTRARLAAQGLCTDTDCEKCGGALDDDHHRVWECTATEPLRMEYTTEEMRRGAGDAERNHRYWTRAITLNPSATVPPPRRDFGEEWHFAPGAAHERNFAGTVYTDGSAFYPQCADIRRAGWAVVQIDSDGGLVKALFGHVPASISTEQTVSAGEIYAMRRATELRIGELTIKTDYQGILDGLQAGEAATTSARRPNAASWRAFWRAADGTAPRAQKVKAHRSREEAAAEGSLEAITDWTGNKWADTYAKRGAALHTNAEGHKAAEAYEGNFKQLTAIATWIGIALSQWPRMAGGRPANKHWRREAGHRRRARRQVAARSQGHDLTHGRDGWHCTVCGRSARTWTGTKRLALSECRGHTATRIRAQGPAPSAHLLWAAEAERSQTGSLAPDVIWCGRCGAYSSAKVYNLARTCRGVPEKSARTRLAAFNIGIHPISRHRLAPPIRLTDEVLSALNLGAAKRRAAFNKLLRGDPTIDRREADDERSGRGGSTEDGRDDFCTEEVHMADADDTLDMPPTTVGYPICDTDEHDVFGHGFAFDEPQRDVGSTEDIRMEPRGSSVAGDRIEFETLDETAAALGRGDPEDQPRKRRRIDCNLKAEPQEEDAAGTSGTTAERQLRPALTAPTDAQSGPADPLRANQAAATHARCDGLSRAANDGAESHACVIVGDRSTDGRSAHGRLVEPSRVRPPHDATAAPLTVERECKRRRIRGKQSPAAVYGGVQPSASRPAHPIAVDQHGLSSTGPRPRA